MRLFAAIPLDREGREAVAAYQAALRRLGVRGNFTRPENLHITLAFLGEQPDERAAAEALETVEREPGRVLLDRLDSFDRSSLLVMGASEDGDIRALAADAASALRRAGFSLEKRRYKAHVTLCRELRAPGGTVLPPPPAVEVPVEELVLYLSHRPGGRLTYTPLWNKKLRGNRQKGIAPAGGLC